MLANLYQPNCTGKLAKFLPLFCREGTEGKSLSINPGTRGTKEVYLNILHKVRGQADKKVSIVLNPGEMIVLKRLAEVRCYS